MLPPLQLEMSILVVYRKLTTGESILNRLRECFIWPDFDDRLESGGKIASIMMKDRRECSNLGGSRGRIRIRAKVIVKPPAAKRFANRKHLRSALRISNRGQHAVCVGEALRQHCWLLVTRGGKPDEVVPAINQCRRFTVCWTMP